MAPRRAPASPTSTSATSSPPSPGNSTSHSPSSAGNATPRAGAQPIKHSRTPRSASAQTASSATATRPAASSSTARAPPLDDLPERRPPRPRPRLRHSRPHARRPRRARPDHLDRPADRRRASSEPAPRRLRRSVAANSHPNAARPARAYLETRGIPADRIDETGLGVMPDATRMRLALASHGYSDAEIAASSVTADSRWEGRIVGAWRDERQPRTTLWARSLSPESDDRYLYLKGAARPATMPYGLSTHPRQRIAHRSP